MPTTDPRAANEGGTYAPLGDYKGSGIAIALAAITSFLSGAVFDDQRPGATGCTNHWFAAYDVAQFVEPEKLTSEVRGVFTYKVDDAGLITNMRGYWNLDVMKFGKEE